MLDSALRAGPFVRLRLIVLSSVVPLINLSSHEVFGASLVRPHPERLQNSLPTLFAYPITDYHFCRVDSTTTRLSQPLFITFLPSFPLWCKVHTELLGTKNWNILSYSYTRVSRVKCNKSSDNIEEILKENIEDN